MACGRTQTARAKLDEYQPRRTPQHPYRDQQKTQLKKNEVESRQRHDLLEAKDVLRQINLRRKRVVLAVHTIGYRSYVST